MNFDWSLTIGSFLQRPAVNSSDCGNLNFKAGLRIKQSNHSTVTPEANL
jgi:hypothetical protein